MKKSVLLLASIVSFSMLAACQTQENSSSILSSSSPVSSSHVHTYDWKHPEWTWAEDYAFATVSFRCLEDGESLTKTATVAKTISKEATCLTPGEAVFEATAEVEGQSFSDRKVEAIAALGHDYDPASAKWVWAEDNSSASVTVTCRRCDTGTEGHSFTASAVVTSTITSAPTCLASGIRSYVAEATIGGKKYTDQKEISVAALGHDYDYDHPTWAWSDDLSSASVSVSCRRCAEGEEGHQKTIAATVSKEVTEAASYTHDGLTTYHAVANVDGHQLEDAKTKTIDMLVPEYYARVNVGAYTDDKLYFESLSSYDSVTMVSFKARLSGSVKSGKDGWWGFGVSQDIASANIYTGMKTVSSSSWDDAWHEINLKVDSSGYLFFICAAGEFESGSHIDLKNIVIHYGTDQVARETFEYASSSLFDGSKAASIWEILTDDSVPNSAIELYPSKASEKVVFKTKTTYAALTAASFDLKVETTKNDAWWGLGLSSDPSFYPSADNAGVFRVGGAVTNWTHYSWKEMATNYWWMNIAGSSAEKDKEGDWSQTKPVYLYLFASTDIASVSVDNFSFTANRKTYQENFDTGLHLFEILNPSAAKLVTRS